MTNKVSLTKPKGNLPRFAKLGSHVVGVVDFNGKIPGGPNVNLTDNISVNFATKKTMAATLSALYA